MFSPVAQFFSSNNKFQCVLDDYDFKVIFFCCAHGLQLTLQSQSSLLDSREGIIKQP